MYPPIIDNLPFPDLELIFVEGGSFLMGISKDDPDAYGDDGSPHMVSLRSFYMAKYPVTQRLWAAVRSSGGWGPRLLISKVCCGQRLM